MPAWQQAAPMPHSDLDGRCSGTHHAGGTSAFCALVTLTPRMLHGGYLQLQRSFAADAGLAGHPACDDPGTSALPDIALVLQDASSVGAASSAVRELRATLRRTAIPQRSGHGQPPLAQPTPQGAPRSPLSEAVCKLHGLGAWLAEQGVTAGSIVRLQFQPPHSFLLDVPTADSVTAVLAASAGSITSCAFGEQPGAAEAARPSPTAGGGATPPPGRVAAPVPVPPTPVTPAAGSAPKPCSWRKPPHGRSSRASTAVTTTTREAACVTALVREVSFVVRLDTLQQKRLELSSRTARSLFGDAVIDAMKIGQELLIGIWDGHSDGSRRMPYTRLMMYERNYGRLWRLLGLGPWMAEHGAKVGQRLVLRRRPGAGLGFGGGVSGGGDGVGGGSSDVGGGGGFDVFLEAGRDGNVAALPGMRPMAAAKSPPTAAAAAAPVLAPGATSGGGGAGNGNSREGFPGRGGDCQFEEHKEQWPGVIKAEGAQHTTGPQVMSPFVQPGKHAQPQDEQQPRAAAQQPVKRKRDSQSVDTAASRKVKRIDPEHPPTISSPASSPTQGAAFARAETKAHRVATAAAAVPLGAGSAAGGGGVGYDERAGKALNPSEAALGRFRATAAMLGPGGVFAHLPRDRQTRVLIEEEGSGRRWETNIVPYKSTNSLRLNSLPGLGVSPGDVILLTHVWIPATSGTRTPEPHEFRMRILRCGSAPADDPRVDPQPACQTRDADAAPAPAPGRSSFGAAQDKGAARRPGVQMPMLRPGELRLCGLTFHPGVAPAVRRGLAAWEQRVLRRRQHQQPPLQQQQQDEADEEDQGTGAGDFSELAALDPRTAQICIPGVDDDIHPAAAAVGVGAFPPSVARRNAAVFSRHGLDRAAVADSLVDWLGLRGHSRWGAALPVGDRALPLAPGLLTQRQDPVRGSQGLFAAAPIAKGTSLGVAGGYVLPRGNAEALAAATCAAAAAGAEGVDDGSGDRAESARSEMLLRSVCLPLPAAKADGGDTAPSAESTASQAAELILLGNEAALVSDPRVIPHSGAEAGAPETDAKLNCAVLPVSVRGLFLPVLVALHDIAPGEQLTRDFGSEWW